jgi:hypothetical protein
VNKLFKKLISNVINSPRTTIGGILTIVGLFTPISPAIIAGGAAVALIVGATDPKSDKEIK